MTYLDWLAAKFYMEDCRGKGKHPCAWQVMNAETKAEYYERVKGPMRAAYMLTSDLAVENHISDLCSRNSTFKADYERWVAMENELEAARQAGSPTAYFVQLV